MATTRIVHADGVEWNSYAGGELAGMHHTGDDGLPQCFEIVCPAGYQGRPHAHEANEVIYVLSGELRVEGETLGPGASISIPGRTLYRLDAGPDGVRYLNFRPTRDMSLLTEVDLD